MKRIIFGMAFSLLGILALCSCNVQTNQPSTVPSTPTANQNVTGVFAGVKVAGGNTTVNVQTAGGTQTYAVLQNTTLTLGGKTCTIGDLAAIQSGNTSYNCTVVFNDAMGVFGVYVTGGTPK